MADNSMKELCEMLVELSTGREHIKLDSSIRDKRFKVWLYRYGFASGSNEGEFEIHWETILNTLNFPFHKRFAKKLLNTDKSSTQTSSTTALEHHEAILDSISNQGILFSMETHITYILRQYREKQRQCKSSDTNESATKDNLEKEAEKLVKSYQDLLKFGVIYKNNVAPNNKIEVIKLVDCVMSDEKKNMLNNVGGDADQWSLSVDMLNREWLNNLIIECVRRKTGDSCAANLMSVIFQYSLESKNQAVSSSSSNFYLNDVFNYVNSVKCSNVRLRQYRSQYLTLLDEERFINKTGNESGGLYSVSYTNWTKRMATQIIEGLVQETYSSKALRIFRLINERGYIEESQIQKEVMMPLKDVKLITYDLMENNLILVKEIKKSFTQATGKTFFLYFVDLNEVCRLFIQICYKALLNLLLKSKFLLDSNSRLLQKHEKVEFMSNEIRRNLENLTPSSDEEEKERLEQELADIEDFMVEPERQGVKAIKANVNLIATSGIEKIVETLFILKQCVHFQTILLRQKAATLNSRKRKVITE